MEEIWFGAAVICPAEIRVLSGPAPVPTARARFEYELMLKTFAQLAKPREIVEWFFVKEWADNRSEVSWLKRLKIHHVQTPLKNYMAICANELSSTDKARVDKLRQKRTAELATKIKELKGSSEQVKAETERLEAEANKELAIEIEEIKFESRKKFIEQQEPIIKSEITEADTFHEWIGPYEQVSKRIAVLDQQFANALEQLDHWRHGGLGERLRKAADEIIDGECNEEFDPSAVQQADGKETPQTPVTNPDATGARGIPRGPAPTKTTLSSRDDDLDCGGPALES
jgi:hypothetical protein